MARVPVNGTAKVLNLILYSPSPYFEEMRDLLSRYLLVKRIEHYFYWYDPDLEEEYVFESNYLRIRGTESLVPGVLEKTLKALELTLDKEYDFVVRSNISTIINFDEQQWNLFPGMFDYGGIILIGSGMEKNHDLGMIGENYDKYHMTPFIVGFHLILSRKAVKTLLAHQDELIRTIVDDMTLGIFFHKRPGIVTGMLGEYTSSMSYNKNEFYPGRIVYRNKANDRSTLEERAAPGYRNKLVDRKPDVANMRVTICHLLSQKFGQIPNKIRHAIDDQIVGCNADLYDVYMRASTTPFAKKIILVCMKLYLSGGVYTDGLILSPEKMTHITSKTNDLFISTEANLLIMGATQYNHKLCQILHHFARGGSVNLDFLNPRPRGTYYVCVIGERAYFSSEENSFSSIILDATLEDEPYMTVRMDTTHRTILHPTRHAPKSGLLEFFHSLWEGTVIMPLRYFCL